MAQSSQQLRIIAEPKAFFRERYGSEFNRPGNRVQRYIRAEKNQLHLEYPTIEIPEEWYDATDNLYIRVASVTVPNEAISTTCVHPYPIDTDDSNVHKDPINNALYFPITNDNVMDGQKKFLLTRKKLIQKELKLVEPLRIVDSNRRHICHKMNESRSKQLIKRYKLWKSQLVFSRAEYIDNQTFLQFPDTSVLSQVMCDETSHEHDTDDPIIMTNDHDERLVICAPQKGAWTGGDNILMVLTKLDRRKALRIYFDYAELNQKKNIQYELIDTKTIVFQTPPCLLAPDGQDRTVSIVAMQNEKIIAKINFLYLQSNISPTTNVFSCSRSHVSSDVGDLNTNNKRPRPNFEDLFED